MAEMIYRANVNGKNFSFICDAWDTRDGFAHGCELWDFDEWHKISSGKCFYLNRTWESYRFQSAMIMAVQHAESQVRSRIRGFVLTEYGWQKITAKRRELLEDVYSKNAELQTLELLESKIKSGMPK